MAFNKMASQRGHLELSEDQALRLRMRAQGLLRQDGYQEISPSQAITAILAVQAQDLPAGMLSLRARAPGLTAAQLDRARQMERTLAWIWCLRGTLHLVSAADAVWLVPFLGPALIAGDRRRLHQLGWDDGSAQLGLQILSEALDQRGELVRPDIIRLLKENSLPSQGQAPMHILFRAALEGRVLRGPQRGKEPAYVSFETWLGKPQPLPYETALERLALRYLAAYAPATPADLAKWSGLKAGEVRAAWELVSEQLVAVTVAGKSAWLLKSQLGWFDGDSISEPLVRLLPRFDTYLLGYASRDQVIAPAFSAQVFDGGIIHAALLVDGQARGVWRMIRRNSRLEIALEPFEKLQTDLIPLIEVEVADIGRFLNTETFLTLGDP